MGQDLHEPSVGDPKELVECRLREKETLRRWFEEGV
jgi:hypothetical protein